MKKDFLLVAVVLLLSGVASGQDGRTALQVGVLFFENVIPPRKASSAELGIHRVDARYDYLERAFTDMLASDLAAFSEVRLLERSKIENLLEELRFHETGAVDEKTAARLGAAAGARFLIYGTIDRRKQKIVVRPKLVDVVRRLAIELPEVTGEEEDILGIESGLSASAAKALGLEQPSPAGPLAFMPGGRLAVLPFFNNSATARLDNLKLALADLVVYRLVKDKRLTLVERAKIDLILREQGLQQTGIVDERTAVRVGKLLGAGALLFGSYLESGDKIRIDARIVEVETGRTLVLKSMSVSREELLEGTDRLFDLP